MRTQLSELKVGDKFRTVGIVTGELSLYTYRKTEDDGRTNAVSLRLSRRGEEIDMPCFIKGSERVETV
jgi:hypothetical protein